MKVELLKWYLEMGVHFCLEDIPQNHMLQMMNNTQRKTSNDELDIYEKYLKQANYLADQCSDLESLAQTIKNFQGCALRNTAINTVFSDGDRNSHIMLIGEAPGFNEDIQGIPFCGTSGALLNKMLNAIELQREEVYISNAVFWRPPDNRKPSDHEISLCRPFVQKHIALMSPKIILLLGGTAVASLLEKSVSVTSLRGYVHKYNNKYTEKPIQLIVTYHPSYLLRQPRQKKAAWDDMLLLKQKYQEIS